MTLVIMAAGMGSRFGGLKQIEPIDKNGNFIIDYSIYDAIKEGYTKVVFIIKEENYDIFRETIGKRIENKIEVEYVFQSLDKLPFGYSVPVGREKPWGTAHAILCCKDVVKTNFTIVNADDFYGRDAFVTASNFIDAIDDEHEYAMAGYIVENTITSNGSVKRGVCEEVNGYLTKLTESLIEYKNDEYIASPLNGSEPFEVRSDTIVSMNMFTFTPDIFAFLEKNFPIFLDNNKDNLKAEYLIPDLVFQQMEEENVKVKVLNTSARWLGVTYKEDKPLVVDAIQKLIEDNEYPENLWD